jgi:hypothetical protein
MAVNSKASTTIRVATWNLDHPKHAAHFPEQMKKLAEISAHVVVLTETSPGADLSSMGYTGVSTPPYQPHVSSKKERNSSAIWSKWPIERAISTYDDETTTCIKIKAPFGSLLVYGTILTWKMDRWPDENGALWSLHDKEIERQGDDWNRIRNLFPGTPLIVAGDFNQVRDGVGTYCSPKGISLLDTELQRNKLHCVTEEDFGAKEILKASPRSKAGYRHNVDHICITSDRFESQPAGAWDHFTADHELTDHNGVYVDLVPK